MRGFVPWCNDRYSYGSEEDRNFSVAWTLGTSPPRCLGVSIPGSRPRRPSVQPPRSRRLGVAAAPLLVHRARARH